MGSFTALLQAALVLMATAHSSTTIATDAVRQQAITVASVAIRMADDAIDQQLLTAQASAPDPAREALDTYLRTLLGRQATLAELFPLSTDASKVEFLANPLASFRDQTGVTVVSVLEVASTTNEALFNVTTHGTDPAETDTFPYDFLRSDGVWKYDLGGSLLHFYGQPMEGAMTSLPVTIPAPVASSTVPSSPQPTP